VKDARVHERELASGEFDAVSKRFLDALALAARERGRPG
jgi:hypothetical protein